MKNLIVKGKNIPLAGSTNLIVQGEINAEELRFTFNTNGEHSFLSTATTWKLWYKRRDGQGLPITLTKTDNQDNTWYLSWLPDNHATYLNGQFAYLIAAYSTANDVNPVWKTTACVINIAKSVDPEIIDPSEKTLSYDQIVDELQTWVNNQKGVANGIATLDSSGKVPASQLDIGELDNYEIGYLYEGNFYKDAEHTQLMTPKENAIYVNKSTNPASLYVYNNSEYQPVSIESLSNYYTKSEINTLLNNINIAITNETTARQGADTSLGNRITTIEGKESGWDAKYDKPNTGIPESDFSEDVKTKLNKQGTVTDVKVDNVSVVSEGVAQINLTGKVDKETGKSLMSTEEHAKLQNIESGAEVNVQSDWNESDSTKDSYIKNKPTIPVVPTKLSDFTDDLGTSPVHTHSQYLTEHQSLADYRKSTDQDVIDATKVDKVSGKGLSENDFTTTEKTKLGALPTNSELEEQYAKKSDITNVYKYMGSVATYNDLPSDFTSRDKGKVYNVIAAHGAYPAGTNYAWAWDTSTSSGTWDALGGSVDLSVFRTSAAQDVIDNTKVDKVQGKELSDNNYTTAEKTKLSGIEAGAEVNVNADWNAESGDAQILNKPSTFPPSSHNHDDRYYTESEADAKFVAIESGKRLMTDAEGTKLSGVEANADVTDATNVKSAGAVMGVKVDGTELTKDSDGKVNVDLSDKVSYQDKASKLEVRTALGLLQVLPIGGKIFHIEPYTSGDYIFFDSNNQQLSDVTSTTDDNGIEHLSANASLVAYYIKVNPQETDHIYVVGKDGSDNMGVSSNKHWTYHNGTDWVYESLGTQDGIGSGKTNTALIMAKDNGAYIKQAGGSQTLDTLWYWLKGLRDNSANGVNDWFIGSEAEIEKLRTVVDSNGNNITTWYNQSSGYYLWSSFEYSFSNIFFWRYYYQNWGNTSKNNINPHGIAIRSF